MGCRCNHQGGGGGLVTLAALALVGIGLGQGLAGKATAGVTAEGMLGKLHGLPSIQVAGPPSSKAARAVTWALRQRGKPYRSGAEGPGAFDCSGLTMAAYRAAGVALPCTAAAQERRGPRVAGSLKPGDLVFYASDSAPSGRHVALYLGGGRVVEAYATGQPVRVRPLRGERTSATRPSAGRG